MQIYETPLCPVKSETMNDAENGKTYAIFETAANRKIIADLKNSNANVLIYPAIDAAKKELNETETAYLNDLNQFDWLIFADVLAVEYFLEILETNAFDFYDLDDLRVCAIGETVSDRLRFASIHADVIPSKIDSQKVFSALSDYIGEAEIGNLKFLYLNGGAENQLTENLRNANAEVAEISIYSLSANENSELIRLKTLLKGGAIDEFIITAPTDLIWLTYYFKPANLTAALHETNIAATDGVMFQAAKEYDLRRVVLFPPNKLAKVI